MLVMNKKIIFRIKSMNYLAWKLLNWEHTETNKSRKLILEMELTVAVSK